MIEENQKEIFNKLDNCSEIKRFKELEKQIKSNDKYNKLINDFNLIDNPSNEDIINLRKKLFEIDGVKEYLSIENDIRLLSRKISNSISSIVNTEKCK